MTNLCGEYFTPPGVPLLGPDDIGTIWWARNDRSQSDGWRIAAILDNYWIVARRPDMNTGLKPAVIPIEFFLHQYERGPAPLPPLIRPFGLLFASGHIYPCENIAQAEQQLDEAVAIVELSYEVVRRVS